LAQNHDWSHANRREFLGAAGGTVVAAALSGGVPASATVATSPSQATGGRKKKIPIGVFDPVYDNLTLDEMLERVSALGLEAMEIGTGGYPGTKHCPVAELLADPAKAKAWKKKFEDRNIRVATFSCHGNPVHPDPKHAAQDAENFKNTVLLAERLEVPSSWDSPGARRKPKETQPNWITTAGLPSTPRCSTGSGKRR
jgi:hypothetical protein